MFDRSSYLFFPGGRRSEHELSGAPSKVFCLACNIFEEQRSVLDGYALQRLVQLHDISSLRILLRDAYTKEAPISSMSNGHHISYSNALMFCSRGYITNVGVVL